GKYELFIYRFAVHNLASGNDQLYGLGGNDTIAAGDGANMVDGGPGLDTVVAAVNANATLTNGSLFADGGAQSSRLSGIEAAVLLGGDGDNTFDASAFTGAVHFSAGGGVNTILGAQTNVISESSPVSFYNNDIIGLLAGGRTLTAAEDQLATEGDAA